MSSEVISAFNLDFLCIISLIQAPILGGNWDNADRDFSCNGCVDHNVVRLRHWRRKHNAEFYRAHVNMRGYN